MVLRASDKAHYVSIVNNLNRPQPTSGELICNQVTILEPFEGWDRGNDGKRKGFCECFILVDSLALLVEIKKFRDDLSAKGEKILYASKCEGTLRIVFGPPTD